MLVPDLTCDRGDPISCRNIVISVATDFLFNYCIAVASLKVVGEAGLLGDLLYDRENSWSPALDIIWLPTVERPHEAVAVRVEVYDKRELALFLFEERPDGLCLLLGEGLFAGVCLRARIMHIIEGPIDTVVAIEVSTL